ncbi:MAG: restriction endonuclease subunit R [Candidatus Acidulodesulfobacterium acidiphilum]|uniref:Restriction endonuclease subunit R n=1 Tax=Candidatus Acidulodesulfobacterium acidiphilum TaxID=2597224 RepID=A0A520XD64_9DELT|nr:MAG: restriction endonuclease subunit R [Candidatus Acidulodesulfobacterium acidiphilum]
MNLYEIIKESVKDWRNGGYKSQFETLTEIFEHINKENYLRQAQIEALENYWYIRNVLGSPTIEELYKKYFEGMELLKALGIPKEILSGLENIPNEDIKKQVYKSFIENIKEDNDFVKRHRLEGVRETLTLSYPSYILALAMGSGKTILIASIIATEFAMSLEYPNEHFIKNALVFAPGKTILGALREISFAPYEIILPKRLFKKFITNVKLIYTQDNQKDIPVIKGSVFNVIVTNTEKIRLTASSIKNSLFKDIKNLQDKKKEEVKELLANQRLQTLTSLPDLGIFSDEAHHTYGQSIGDELKKIRQTINYIADKTNLKVVINTTGTPYYQKKILRDVIYWYGLKQGIKDGILKDVSGNIKAFEDVNNSYFTQIVTEDFIREYWNVKIYDGTKAKLAFYFPQIDYIKNAKETIEKVLIKNNINPNEILLEVHSNSKDEIKDLFDNRINSPSVPFRILLLVNKGTEGWNCPSLFATALARELTGSNNFCLQAASRCLRQIPNNTKKAKIYLSQKNVSILDNQLQETYGESLNDINLQSSELISIRLTIRKTKVQPISVKEKVKNVVLKETVDKSKLYFPELDVTPQKIKVQSNTLTLSDKKGKVLNIIDENTFEIEEQTSGIYFVATELADTYRLKSLNVLKLLKKAFNNKTEIPLSVIDKLKEIIEEQLSKYEIKEEIIEKALALLKLDGFNNDETSYYTEIKINKRRFDELCLDINKYPNMKFGFHYTPYNFDSKPEKDFYNSILLRLGEDIDDVEDVYFTGAITSYNKTDLLFEYKGNDGKWHTYTPDFIIRKASGKILIIEIKGEPFRNNLIEKSMKEMENLNAEKIKYEILETDGENLVYGELDKIYNLIYKGQ